VGVGWWGILCAAFTVFRCGSPLPLCFFVAYPASGIYSVSVVTAHAGGSSSSDSSLQVRVPFNSSIVATKQHIALVLQQQQHRPSTSSSSGSGGAAGNHAAWSVAEMQLEFKGIVLPDNSTLDLCGIGDGSTVILARATYVRQQQQPPEADTQRSSSSSSSPVRLKTRVATASQNKSRSRSRAEEELPPPLDANAIRKIVKESVVETVREIETHTVEIVRTQLEGNP
jgi:hypothetical protein